MIMDLFFGQFGSLSIKFSRNKNNYIKLVEREKETFAIKGAIHKHEIMMSIVMKQTLLLLQLYLIVHSLVLTGTNNRQRDEIRISPHHGGWDALFIMAPPETSQTSRQYGTEKFKGAPQNKHEQNSNMTWNCP